MTDQSPASKSHKEHIQKRFIMIHSLSHIVDEICKIAIKRSFLIRMRHKAECDKYLYKHFVIFDN